MARREARLFEQNGGGYGDGGGDGGGARRRRPADEAEEVNGGSDDDGGGGGGGGGGYGGGRGGAGRGRGRGGPGGGPKMHRPLPPGATLSTVCKTLSPNEQEQVSRVMREPYLAGIGLAATLAFDPRATRSAHESVERWTLACGRSVNYADIVNRVYVVDDAGDDSAAGAAGLAIRPGDGNCPDGRGTGELPSPPEHDDYTV